VEDQTSTKVRLNRFSNQLEEASTHKSAKTHAGNAFKVSKQQLLQRRKTGQLGFYYSYRPYLFYNSTIVSAGVK